MARRVDNRELAVARVYAQSLLALAEEAGNADEIQAELAALAGEVASSDELAAFLASPLVGVSERAEALETIFRGRLSDLLLDTLQVMNEKGRLGLVRALAVALQEELDRLRGRVDVEVTTAVALSAELRERLHTVVAERTGKQPRLTESVDPEILGGMVLRIADRKIDASVASELRRLDQRLKDRMSAAVRSGME
ncbi:MAG: ATP synthase F1 subunit delta [Thermoanaerobaculia bacterium]